MININKQIAKSANKNIKAGEFFGKLFQIRDEIHLTHLNVSGIGSYATHKALNEFYDEILDLMDSLIESYQGKYGLTEINIPASEKVDPITAIENLVKLTDSGMAYIMFKETWIQNQIDEISTLAYQTLYKLKNLK
jgi:hypothetical protein